MLELPPLNAETLLQVLILAAGVYLLLSFLETTRGSGLVRGLGVALLVGGPGLWLLTVVFELEQLQHVLRAIAQVAVIVLVILFHPELRRGIMRLGDNELVARLFKSDRTAAVDQVVQAIVSMARDKVGALVAFERTVPLDAYVERGVRIDAEVNRLLLESLFHEGNKLHDGAVILRGDRIEGAACILPLSENQELSKSTGTRHRAALGLTEETDAVAVVVSEETGLISVCREGSMERRIARDALEEVLRDLLAPRQRGEERKGPAHHLLRLFTRRPVPKLISLLLGLVLFLGAWRAERAEITLLLDVQLVALSGDQEGSASLETLRVLHPDDVRARFDLGDSTSAEPVHVKVRMNAPRDLLPQFQQGIFGQVVLVSGETGRKDLRISDFTWGPGRAFLDGTVQLEWVDPPPSLVLERYEQQKVVPTPASVLVHSEQLGPGWEVDGPNLTFVPTNIQLRGTASALGNAQARIETGQLFEPVVLPARQWSEWQQQPNWATRLVLAQELRDLDIELVDVVSVVVPILPRLERVGEVEVDVAVVSTNTEHPERAGAYAPPRERVRLVIEAEGILTGEDQDDRSLILALRGTVESEARAWVDVGFAEVGTQVFEVRVADIPRDVWFHQLSPTVQTRLQGGARAQRLQLRAEPATLELRPVAESDDDTRDEQD